MLSWTGDCTIPDDAYTYEQGKITLTQENYNKGHCGPGFMDSASSYGPSSFPLGERFVDGYTRTCDEDNQTLIIEGVIKIKNDANLCVSQDSIRAQIVDEALLIEGEPLWNFVNFFPQGTKISWTGDCTKGTF